MCNVGNLIRAAILNDLAGRLSGTELEDFKAWLVESDVSGYYFDRLLSLKAVANDLRTISREWARPVNEKALDILCKISDAQDVGREIDKRFSSFETFIQYKDAEIDACFVGLGV